MKIAIDTSPLTTPHQGRGVGTYTRELIAHLPLVNSDIDFVFTPNPSSVKADLIHYPYFDLFFQTLPIFSSTPTVVTIHDLIPLRYPSHFPSGIKGKINFYIQRFTLNRANRIITDSQASANDIHHFLSQPKNRIDTIPLAVSHQFSPQPVSLQNKFKTKHNLPDKFLGYVGDINYNKNLPQLISSLKDLPQIHLVIVTRADINSQIPEAQAIRSSLNQADTHSRVHFLSLDSLEDLNLFYSSAFWYIQPSLWEGFGLPVLEAMASGTPCLVAKAGSLPEIAGISALYFDPTNEASISKTIKQAFNLNSSSRSKMIKESIQHAKKFTWKQTASKTINSYIKAIKQ